MSVSKVMGQLCVPMAVFRWPLHSDDIFCSTLLVPVCVIMPKAHKIYRNKITCGCCQLSIYQTTYTGLNSPAESKGRVDSTYILSRIILVKRFFRFWWKFSGKRQRMSSALVKPRYTTCLVRLCKADTSCGRQGEKGLPWEALPTAQDGPS